MPELEGIEVVPDLLESGMAVLGVGMAAAGLPLSLGFGGGGDTFFAEPCFERFELGGWHGGVCVEY